MKSLAVPILWWFNGPSPPQPTPFFQGYLSFWEFLASLEGDPGKCKLETNASPRGGGE